MANAPTIPAPRETAVSGPIAPSESAGAPPAPEHSAPSQLAVTIVAKVRREKLPALRRILRTMGKDPGANAVLPLAALPRTHYARFLLLDATKDQTGVAIEPQLVFMADVDRPAEVHSALEHCLGELVDVAGDGLDRIFGGCAGYPATSRATRGRRLAFLREHAVEAAATYVNTVRRSVRQIQQEALLRAAIEDFLDRSEADLRDCEPRAVRAAIQDFVAAQEELAWARTPPPPAGIVDRLSDAVNLLWLPAGLLALSPVIVPALPLLALALRRQERSDPAPHIKPTHDHVVALAELEDHGPQNQFSAVGFLKPGLVRRLTAEVVTRGIDYASRHVFNHANLAGVKTIHFARWVFLDDHRRMVFASSYDGSLENYNDDFIHIVGWGLNAIFSNGIGYPRTNWLFFGGASQEEEFKDYLRRHQVPTQVWYAAYPDLTALNIENNARIRVGLNGAMSAQETERWLQLI